MSRAVANKYAFQNKGRRKNNKLWRITKRKRWSIKILRFKQRKKLFKFF